MRRLFPGVKDSLSVQVVGGVPDLSIMNSNLIMISYQHQNAAFQNCTLSGEPAGTFVIQVTTNLTGNAPYTLRIGPR